MMKMESVCPFTRFENQKKALESFLDGSHPCKDFDLLSTNYVDVTGRMCLLGLILNLPASEAGPNSNTPDGWSGVTLKRWEAFFLDPYRINYHRPLDAEDCLGAVLVLEQLEYPSEAFELPVHADLLNFLSNYWNLTKEELALLT